MMPRSFGQQEYRKFLNDFDLTQARAAALLADATSRTGRRWATEETPIPYSIALLIAIIRCYSIDIEDLEELGKPFHTRK